MILSVLLKDIWTNCMGYPSEMSRSLSNGSLKGTPVVISSFREQKKRLKIKIKGLHAIQDTN